MAGVGPRDSFAKGGSENILRDALTEALGVDLRIETIVDPSVTSGGGRGGASAPRGAAAPASPPEGAVAAERSEPAAESRSAEPPAGSGAIAWEPVPGREPPPPSEPPPPTGESGPSGPPGVVAATDAGWREQARQGIRPTRPGAAAAGSAETEDDRDASVSLHDSDIDELDESHTDLLARQLGAEIIGEEPHQP
jgi:DNA polymerase-3 subunit gamma/tau